MHPWRRMNNGVDDFVAWSKERVERFLIQLESRDRVCPTYAVNSEFLLGRIHDKNRRVRRLAKYRH